jgi:hypothetical protein
MKNSTAKKQDILDRVRPLLDQDAHEIQPFGTIAKLPIALAEDVCKASVDNINQLIADTITLCDIYKRHRSRLAPFSFDRFSLRSRNCLSQQHRSTVQSTDAFVRGSLTPTTCAVPAGTDCTPS